MASPSSFQLGLLLSSPFVCFCPVSSLGSTVVSCGSSVVLRVVCSGVGTGCSDSGGCNCGDFPPRLILPHRAPGSFVVVWIGVVVFVLAGGCVVGEGSDLDFFAVVEIHKTRKGLVRLTRKDLG
ncbi:transmembrane protein, putative [Medicago truncatula]|uniref:Transmembrane protein, putative n=1 Tax=Medicago truncatula TaxID=3880 RepID=G7I7U3_MEDTR|nr:transmembrane protein, putative [Medicago truncatula]